MKTKTVKCRYCEQEFEALVKELNRGNAKFCSRSCAAKHSNENRPLIQCTCKICGIVFNTVHSTTRYCSQKCKRRSAYLRREMPKGVNTRKVVNMLRQAPCAVCGWDEAPRHLHHIQPVSEGGTNELTNLISLCPNHHAMADLNLISQEELQELLVSRTISSSLNIAA